MTKTITIKTSFKFGNKKGIWAPKRFDESTNFGLDSYLYKHVKRKNIAFRIDSCWYENARPQTTNTTNIIVKTQRNSSKIVCIRGSILFLSSTRRSSDLVQSVILPYRKNRICKMWLKFCNKIHSISWESSNQPSTMDINIFYAKDS